MKRLLPVLFLASNVFGQCVMCGRTAAAQNIERAKALNSGILVLLIPPCMIMGGVLLLAWRRRQP